MVADVALALVPGSPHWSGSARAATGWSAGVLVLVGRSLVLPRHQGWPHLG